MNYSKGLFLGIGATVAFTNAKAANLVKPLNVVFILIDDLGIKDLGCYGSDYYESPNCDKLASQGMQFTEAYAAAAVSSPTRASLQTGKYPGRLHLTEFIPGDEPIAAKLERPDWTMYLRNSELSMGEAFKEAGYSTCYIGKWHLGTVNGPRQHGYDAVTDFRDGKNLVDPWSVDFYTSSLEKFIENNRNKPFFAVLAHGTVHVPLHEKEELIVKYRAKPTGLSGQNNPVMAAMIERMDDSVGRIMKKLKELELDKNTAIVFTSDNGGLKDVFDIESKKTVTATSNKPYRGGKGQLYEGGIRVPLIISFPGMIKEGSVCSFPVISNDIYPTFLDMVGLPLCPTQHLDGLSLLPLLKGKKSIQRNNLYWHYPHYHSIPPHSAIRSGNWKLIKFYETEKVELYDLQKDPSEKNDLSAKEPEIAQELALFLKNHLDVIGAQIPTLNLNFNPALPWMKSKVRNEWDVKRESNQESDTRIYVNDFDKDYGAHWKLK